MIRSVVSPSFLPRSIFNALCSILDQPRNTERRGGRFHRSASRNDPTSLAFAPDIGVQRMEGDLQTTNTLAEELWGIETVYSESPFDQVDLTRRRARKAGGGCFRWQYHIPAHGLCQTDYIKRTFDCEPLIEEFVKHFQKEVKLPP
jgi:hypothetical protein